MQKWRLRGRKIGKNKEETKTKDIRKMKQQKEKKIIQKRSKS